MRLRLSRQEVSLGVRRLLQLRRRSVRGTLVVRCSLTRFCTKSFRKSSQKDECRRRKVCNHMQTDEQRTVRWPWGGIAGLVAVFVALLAQASALGHHNHTAADVFRGIAMVAVVVAIGLLFRWAVLYERAKSPKSPQVKN